MLIAIQQARANETPKDFVEFTGHRPSDYVCLRRRFSTEHPEHALDVGPLPTD
jgi:hypothetical protein